MQTYSKKVAEAILRGHFVSQFEIRDNGVWTVPFERPEDEWTAVCDLEGPEAPDPLTTPSLPFPFTANQLAAFMLDGPGAGLTTVYGNWVDEPDAETLEEIGVQGTKVREVLRAAYAILRQTQDAVGALDMEQQQRAEELRLKLARASHRAYKRERAIGPSFPSVERLRRIATAEELMSALKAEATRALADSGTAFRTWRRSMVQQLLQPQDQQNQKTGSEQTKPEGEEPNYAMLATPSQLIAAFGSMSGMNSRWFRSMKDRPAIVNAVVVPGVRGRNGEPPLLDVFRVMQYLIDPKRKGKKMRAETGWRLLKVHFKKVYEAHEALDPSIPD